MLKVDSVSHGDIYIVGDVELTNGDVVLSKDVETETLFVRKTNIEGIFTYGARNNVEDRVWGKPAGYIWSSRASVMNKAFDVALIDVYYKEEGSYSYRCAAIDLAHLEPLLADTEYEINWEPKFEKEDVIYKLKKKSV
jgi:hypothetical protein